MARRPRPKMEFKLPRHPSGRPILFDRRTELPFKRHLHEEPMTPGLKPGRERTHAIGFTVNIPDDDE